MARPSKADIEKRERIIELEVFKRDSEIYTYFEDFLGQKDDCFAHPYYFCRECEKRDFESNNFFKDITKASAKRFSSPTNPFLDFDEEPIVQGDLAQTNYDIASYDFDEEPIVQYGMITGKNEIIEKNSFHKQIDKYNELKEIDEFISEYFLLLLVETHHSYNLYLKDNRYQNYKAKGYVVTNEMNNDILKNALSKERYEFFYDFYHNSLRLELIVEKGLFMDEPLTDEEKSKVSEELNRYGYRPDKTLIDRHPLFHSIDSIVNDNKNKNVYAELDLTKPIEEIVAYITKLKNDFDENPSNFKNAYEILGEKHEPYQCNLKDCEIYKGKNPKPISGRLADVLFIYDCKKIGLHEDYIIDEINNYWINVKQISTDKFHSIKDYYDIAKEYINDKKYIDYLTGVDKTPL